MSKTKTNVHAEWLRARAVSPYFALARSGLLDSANAIERLDDAIKRLERELAEARAERDQYRVMWERDSKALGDAIGQRDTARSVAEDNRARYVTAESECDEARAENERLREALRIAQGAAAVSVGL